MAINFAGLTEGISATISWTDGAILTAQRFATLFWINSVAVVITNLSIVLDLLDTGSLWSIYPSLDMDFAGHSCLFILGFIEIE